MEVLYRGFDGLDIAFQGRIPVALVGQLEEAKFAAQQQMQPVLIEWQGREFHVTETGARGGYAFIVSTDDEIWFFKRGQKVQDWNIRVSVRSRTLAVYHLGGVRHRLYEFLTAIGADVLGESISRVDYCIDILAPNFELDPTAIICHSHTNRHDYVTPEPMRQSGKSGRYSSVTIGEMPGRQIIIYDKRAEVIQKNKVEWWAIWNAVREAVGEPPFDRKNCQCPRIWRVELRAGKKHLKDTWNIITWTDLDTKVGDMFREALTQVRYVERLETDSNRARWPLHPLWRIVEMQIVEDLQEMTSGVEPSRVKRVRRDELQMRIERFLAGIAATYLVAHGVEHDTPGTLASRIAASLTQQWQGDPERFQRSLQRAQQRYVFLDIIGRDAD